MNPKKIKVAVVGTLLMGSLVSLVVMSFSENMVYAVTVGEFVSKEARYAERGVRIEGILTPGTHKTYRTSEGAAHRFQVYERTDESVYVDVEFVGPVPDTFRDGSELMVEGRMGEKNVFAATAVTPKCASKYEPLDALEEGSPDSPAKDPNQGLPFKIPSDVKTP